MKTSSQFNPIPPAMRHSPLHYVDKLPVVAKTLPVLITPPAFTQNNIPRAPVNVPEQNHLTHGVTPRDFQLLLATHTCYGPGCEVAAITPAIIDSTGHEIGRIVDTWT